MRKNWTKMRRDRRADIGIGTMIVFIAMVLVAAVAAAVLISTANQVREQATSTGDQAINNVAAGFVKVGVTGVADATGIANVTVNLKLAAGSPDVLLANVVVNAIIAGKATSAIVAGSTGAHVKNLGDQTATIATQGDIVSYTITPTAAQGVLVPLSTMEISFIPAFGQATYISFTVPETLVNTYIYVLG